MQVYFHSPWGMHYAVYDSSKASDNHQHCFVVCLLSLCSWRHCASCPVSLRTAIAATPHFTLAVSITDARCVAHSSACVRVHVTLIVSMRAHAKPS